MTLERTTKYIHVKSISFASGELDSETMGLLADFFSTYKNHYVETDQDDSRIIFDAYETRLETEEEHEIRLKTFYASLKSLRNYHEEHNQNK